MSTEKLPEHYRDAIETKVTEIVKRLANSETVDKTSDLPSQYSLDSLDMMEIMMDIEKEYAIDFPQDYIETDKTRTLTQIIDVTERRINEVHYKGK